MASERTRGRPRSFDPDEALMKALDLFWSNGFEATSVADVAAEVGVNKPSLYSAFGDKDQLFASAVALYSKLFAETIGDALEKPDLYVALELFFERAIAFLTSSEHPHGCLAVQGALSCSESTANARKTLLDVRLNLEATLLARIRKAVAEKNFPDDLPPRDFAKYLCTVYQGLAIQSISSPSRKELLRVAKLALAGLAPST